MEQCDRRSGRLGEVLCQRKCADGAVLDLRPFMGENQPGRIFFDIERAVQTVPIFRCCGRPRNGNVWSGDLPGTEDMYAAVPVLCIKACDQIPAAFVMVNLRSPEVFRSPEAFRRAKGVFRLRLELQVPAAVYLKTDADAVPWVRIRCAEQIVLHGGAVCNDEWVTDSNMICRNCIQYLRPRL